MTIFLLRVCAISFLSALASVAQAAPAVEIVMPLTPVDRDGDKNLFATPFDYRDGMIFVVGVETPSDKLLTKMNLLTVVRKGKRGTGGDWAWENTVVEPRTLSDPWHNQASLALDREGYVHVAYNMHNMPWQYSVSVRPYDISEFRFRGQAVSAAELATVKLLNKIPFPTVGEAAIPGNQITYPAFYHDRSGDLYVTYRFALRPARAWKDRGFAGGIAKYDVATRAWQPIGGQVVRSAADVGLASGQTAPAGYAFAFEDQHSVYLQTLAFDAKNGMHVLWNWRPGGAGMATINPSYAYSPDGVRFLTAGEKTLSLPIAVPTADPVAGWPEAQTFYAPKSVAIDAAGRILAVFHPIGGSRKLVTLDRASKDWTRPEDMPSSAPEIHVAGDGTQWAFSSGIRAFRRTGSGRWQQVAQMGEKLCNPKAKYVAPERAFYVHAKTCDGTAVAIYRLQAG